MLLYDTRKHSFRNNIYIVTIFREKNEIYSMDYI